ncbi:hypothetical protein GCM10028857_03060 [Salinarchaeum chitinilyticum]
MALQYARLFQLRAGIQLIGDEGPLSKNELAEMLRQRKDFDVGDQVSTDGAEDIIGGLRRAYLVVESSDGYRLTNESDLEELVGDQTLLYTGESAHGAGDERAQAERILANIMYEHPMLIQLSKYVFQRGPVKSYEAKKKFDGTDYFGDVMNSFTIDMGINLLSDAGVFEDTANGYTGSRWPVRLFTHVVFEEVSDLIDKETESVREPKLFERIETIYGIDRVAFDRLLSQLHAEGIVSESSYEELILNPETLSNTNIHE